MRNWLIKHFVKDYENIQDTNVRYSYGQLGSVIGIICNIVLVIIKISIGLSINAISVISDGINNLSDCASCFMTLVGNFFAVKPADKEHPFGHGRIEYIGSLAVGFIILLAAWELLKTSAERIINPISIEFSYVSIILLILSIFIKLWMYFFDNYIGNTIQHLGMKAAAKDSLNDVFTSLITIIGILLSKYSAGYSIDGIIGVIVSIIIFKEGFEIIKEVVDQIIGKPVDNDLVSKIKNIIFSHKEILGVHDIVIHEYGPNNYLGSVHAEIDSQMEFKKVHKIIDAAEREIFNSLGVKISIHADPKEIDNPLLNQYEIRLKNFLKPIDEKLTYHDFQIYKNDNSIKLVFDVLIPYSCSKTENEIIQLLEESFKNDIPNVELVIVFDNDYTD